MIEDLLSPEKSNPIVIQTNSLEKEQFEILSQKSFNEVSQEFLDSYNSPVKFLKESGKLGLTGVGRYAGIMAIFIVLNFVLFVYSIFHLINYGFSLDQLKYIFLVLALCIGFSIFASIKAYRFALVAALKDVYPNVRPLIFKMSELIIKQADRLFKESQNVKDERVRTAIDYARIVNDYFIKLPRLLKKALIFLLNRIPLFPMLMPLKTEILQGRSKEASILLYEDINGFLNDFFDNNNRRWIIWFLPLNLGVVIAVIMYTLS